MLVCVCVYIYIHTYPRCADQASEGVTEQLRDVRPPGCPGSEIRVHDRNPASYPEEGVYTIIPIV